MQANNYLTVAPERGDERGKPEPVHIFGASSQEYAPPRALVVILFNDQDSDQVAQALKQAELRQHDAHGRRPRVAAWRPVPGHHLSQIGEANAGHCPAL
jgi:hypothetical protein